MNLFELEAVLRLNSSEYSKGISDAEKEGTTFIQKIGNAWTSVKSKYQTVSTVLKPVTDLVGEVVDKYSDFQQMTGGLRQVFGSTADSIIARSKQAYKTAGLSMNDYMDMVISTGAKLLNDLGHDTQAAADMSDKAIVQMADNVNAFGTSWESVSNAYSGFSRGIFTMLDNLKLGFGGTKAEMERLLEMASNISVSDIIKENLDPKDFSSFVGKSVDDFEKAYTQYNQLLGKAQEYAAENKIDFGEEGFAGFMAEHFGYDAKDMAVLQIMASNYASMAEAAREIAKTQGIDVEFDIGSYADMIEAIGIVQENLGIAGTTAREAEATIAGSRASMASQWENLQTLMGDPNATREEIDAASKEMAGTIGKYIKNLVPVIVTALRSLLEVGQELFPELAKVIGEMLPPWLQSGLELIGTMISGIFSIVQAIATHLEAVPRGMEISRAAYIAAFGWEQGNAYFEKKEHLTGKSGAWGDITPDEYREILAAGARVESALRTEEERKEQEREINELNAEMAAREAQASTNFTNQDLEILNKALADTMAKQAKENGFGVAPPKRYVQQNDDGTYSEVMVTVQGDVAVEHYEDLNSAIASLISTITKMGGLDALPWQYAPKTKFEDNSPNHAKGLWDVPYDDYYARLHRGEMVLTASEARDYREGSGSSDAVVAAIQRLSNEMQNLKIVVGQKVFGQTVVDYSGKRMNDYIGKAEDKMTSGYGWG